MSLIVPKTRTSRLMTLAARLMAQRAEHAKGWHRGEYVCNCEHAFDALYEARLIAGLYADMREFECPEAA
jgi:hypothetical protein